jgi:hypothetical protein
LSLFLGVFDDLMEVWCVKGAETFGAKDDTDLCFRIRVNVSLIIRRESSLGRCFDSWLRGSTKQALE